MIDLEFFSVKDLINELQNRQTFVGIIISSKDEHFSDGQRHSDFELSTTMNDDTTLDLLDKITEQFRTQSVETKNA